MGCRRPFNWDAQYRNAEQALQNGDSEAAGELARAGYDALRASDPATAWKFRILNAQAVLRRQNPADALALLDNPPSSLPTQVLVSINLAKSNTLCALKRDGQAAALLNNIDSVLSASDPLRIQLEFNSGKCSESGDRALAIRHLQSAASLAHGIDGFWEARAFTEIGYLLMLDGRYDQAIEQFSRALKVANSPWLKQLALGDMGFCYLNLGDWRQASGYLEQAEALAGTVKDAKPNRALWLIDLGKQRFSQLQYPQAEQSWTEALAIARELNDSLLKAKCLNNLAVVAMSAGDRVAAERYITEGKQLQIPDQEQFHLLLTQAKLAKLEGNTETSELLMQQILSRDPYPELRFDTDTELATLYSEQARVREAERMFRAGIATAEKAFSEVRSDRFRISFMDREPFYDQYVRFLIHQNRTVDALAIAERGRSRALANGLNLSDNEINLRSVQRTLRSRGQVVMAYWLSWEAESYLWVITPSEVKLFKLPSEKEIDDAIDAYTQEVLDISTPQESGLGQRLYEMLVAPAEKYIPKGSKVIIVPHRRLYKLNFETLVPPHPTPHFWIEDVCIQNASFLAVLQNPRRTEPRYSKDLLLMGAPVQASKDFPGLAHAPEEIQKVSAHFRQAKETVLEGRQATPDAYDQSDPRQYRFFHFVTHGTASDTNPLDSAIILSPGSDGYKLYARDIVKTGIHPELVTISTCYGAGTRQYSGEGLVGLAWAFMRVGAHQVVAALWEVDDAANADLMDQFYAELTSGKSVAAALRDGKLAMLHSRGPRKRPYYWASLQLYTGP